MATPTTTFTWSVGTMDRQLSNGAVQTVHYTVSANDGTYSSGAYGSVGLDQPESDSDLTPYARFDGELGNFSSASQAWWCGKGC